MKKVAKNKVKAIKKFVCFGGGNAMPKAVLAKLIEYPVKISTIASMLESGGSSAQFRMDFKTLPPGDIRRHLIAFSSAPDWKKELFSLRVGRETFDGGHKGHSFGNVFISGLEYINKDFGKALDIAHDFLEVKEHKVLPATIELSHIYAVLENDELIFGEDEIDVPLKHDPKLRIKQLFLTKKVKAYFPALEAIREADVITIGPGDLYSSLIPCFLPAGMSEAVKKSKAKKILIVNAMTKLGETNDYSVMDFAKEVEKYMGCSLDYVIYNSEIPDKKRIEEYKKEEPSVIEPVKIDPLINSRQAGKKFIGAKILTKEGAIIYDAEKLVKTIMSLL